MPVFCETNFNVVILYVFILAHVSYDQMSPCNGHVEATFEATVSQNTEQKHVFLVALYWSSKVIKRIQI